MVRKNNNTFKFILIPILAYISFASFEFRNKTDSIGIGLICIVVGIISAGSVIVIIASSINSDGE